MATGTMITEPRDIASMRLIQVPVERDDFVLP